MLDKYTYIAKVSYDDDGITIIFPDLDGCFSCCDNEDEIFQTANEILGLTLFGMERDNEPIPEPSTLKNIKLESNETAILVTVFMPPIRDNINSKVVKKTLTIPYWLNAEAERYNINFSQLLQKSLKEYLQIAK